MVRHRKKIIDKKELIVFGAGGHARAIIDAAENIGFHIHGIIDVDYKNQNEKILNYPVLGNFAVLDKFDPVDTGIAIAIGDGYQRAEYFNKIQKLGFSFPFIIHPTAIISKHVKIGKGVFINAGVIINAKVDIGDNTIINTGVIIEHEVAVGKHCHICPGVKIGGRVTIGDHTFVGIGSSVIDYTKIQGDVTIGAGSVIIRDIESNSTVVGVPGKRIK